LSWRLGCDVGGTFTDFLLHDSATGAITTLKVPTTPLAPEDGVMQGLATLIAQHPGLLANLSAVIHGTTLVINAILERKGAETALIATRGFPDILETRREIRYDIYDIRQRFPAPLIPRRRRREVTERILADGSVDTALNETEALQLLHDLVADGVTSVAVCLIHSYANPTHERAIARLANDHALPLDISLSCDVLPEIQEFERTSTTAINAYVRPKVDSYLRQMELGLQQGGYARPLFLMQSGGGVISATAARAAPVRLAESGPVGGALAARALALVAGYQDAIAFDMGGTTAKTCLIAGGEMPVTRSYEVDRVHRFKRGSGTPIAVPTVDLIEIGAGGGSIASVDALGLIRIGPESAAADPGPACYGRGGIHATVTDANVLLGYLDPTDFLAGAMQLDLEAAEKAIARDVGNPLGVTPMQAAAAMIEVVNENMAQAARMYVAERGGDLQRAVMVAFGGGGPLHAHQVARKLGVSRILIPEAAGVFSALGFLSAAPAYEVARSRPMKLSAVTPAALEETFAALAKEAKAVVSQAAPGAPILVKRFAEMRYVGQGHQLRVLLETLDRSAIASAFAATYHAAYGYAYDDLEPEIVTLRLAAVADQSTALVTGASHLVEGTTALRAAWDPSSARMVPHQTLPFAALSGSISGAALLSQPGATVLIGAGALAKRIPGGWLEITLETAT
jgi:N-methylhydantoinase A